MSAPTTAKGAAAKGAAAKGAPAKAAVKKKAKPGTAANRTRAQTPTAARRWASATKGKLTDWLDRPMTSLHLLLAVFFLLLAYGLLMVLSSSSVKSFKAGGSSFSVFKDQLIFAGIGLVGFYACMRIKLSWLRGVSTAGMVIALALLVVVLGSTELNGARSWIQFPGFTLQPSEVAKFAMVVWGAHVLASRKSNLGSMKELLIPVLPIAALMGGLIMLEPDMGTTAALMIIVFALFFFAGASWWLFGVLATTGVGLLVVYAFSTEYALKRLVSFANPEANPKGSGLQLLQGLYGMADGGLFGVGLGQSRAKWQYLPHAESDFIFAIVGEELGLIGAALLVGLYFTLAIVGLRIARRNMDPFVKLVAATSTAWLVGQAAINIFYVIGLLPVTGIPLPMISAGGTSLIVTMAIFGLLANFARREPKAMAVLQEKGPGRLSRMLGFGVPNSAGQEAKDLAAKTEKRKNKEWARTSARKAVQEKKTIKAASRNRAQSQRAAEKQQARAEKAAARGRAQAAKRRREQPIRPTRPAPQSRLQPPASPRPRRPGGRTQGEQPAARPRPQGQSRSDVRPGERSGRPAGSTHRSPQRPHERPTTRQRSDGSAQLSRSRNPRNTRPPKDEQDY